MHVQWLDSSPWPLYHRGNNRRYPLNMRLGGPQSHSERFGDFSCRQSNPVSSSPQASHYTDYAIPAHDDDDDIPSVAFVTNRTVDEFRFVVSFQYSVRLP